MFGEENCIIPKWVLELFPVSKKYEEFPIYLEDTLGVALLILLKDASILGLSEGKEGECEVPRILGAPNELSSWLSILL